MIPAGVCIQIHSHHRDESARCRWGITIRRIRWRATLSVRAARKRSESTTPSDSNWGRIISGSICPEATERTFPKLQLQMLYTSPRNDPSSWAGSTASTDKLRLRAICREPLLRLERITEPTKHRTPQDLLDAWHSECLKEVCVMGLRRKPKSRLHTSLKIFKHTDILRPEGNRCIPKG